MEYGQGNSSTQTEVEQIFQQHVGDADGFMPVADLAALSGVSDKSVYQYCQGRAGAAVALVMLGRENPEVAQQVCYQMGGMFTPMAAQQGHGCVRELLAIIAQAAAELARMLVDGVFCHRDRAQTHNIANRLMTRLALWRVAN